MSFEKKHKKKGLKKIQANSAKAMSTCAEAIKDLVKPKDISQRVAATNSIHLPTSLTPSLGNVLVLTSPGSQALLDKVQGQGSNQATGCSFSSGSCYSPYSGSHRCPGPHPSSTVKASACRCDNRRTSVTPRLLRSWGWCPSWLLVQINLRQKNQ